MTLRCGVAPAPAFTPSLCIRSRRSTAGETRRIWARPSQIPHRDLVHPLALLYDKVEFTDLVAEQKTRARGNHNRRIVGASEGRLGDELDAL
ncbi:hypothetical protein KOW79_007926 [Hemibagrus wyckioides]|uniref:Uncharacterized protein n=1 Tax=Hemibagrus wyckioides TaxID=337641 RepID=A0A9D3SL20_9TELE|nr:hypothetical protein KOW79_007926 [Hemibagrus wyckioides]